MDLPLHQSLSPELRLMSFQLWVMKWTGLVGPQGKFYRFYIALAYGTFIKIVPKVILGMGSDQLTIIIKGLSELLFQSNIYLSAALLAWHLASFNRMINVMSEIVRKVTQDNRSKACYDLICKENSKLNKFAKFYGIYVIIGSFFYCVPQMIISYLRYFGASNNITDGGASEPIQFELPMEVDFYGMQIRTNFTHYHIYMACSALGCFTGAYMTTIKVTAVVSGMRCSSLAYRLVAMQARKLNDSRGPKTTTADIKEIIELHNKAFEITDLLETIVNVPLATQFLSCLLFWCLVMLYVSIDINWNLVNMAVPFFVSLIETYAYSYLGSELTAEAEEVGKAIYELPWYEDSVELQRYYCLIIQRSQRTTGTTAVKFFLVGVEQFGGLLQTSYSYYLVLKEVFGTL